MASLYEEQIRAEDTAYVLLTEHGSNSQAEAGSYFPELADYNGGVAGHLETLQRARESLDIPVIASLNGTTTEGWVEHARALEQAGAAAIELNVYSVPVDPQVSGADVERRTPDAALTRSTPTIPSASASGRRGCRRARRDWRSGCPDHPTTCRSRTSCARR